MTTQNNENHIWYIQLHKHLWSKVWTSLKLLCSNFLCQVFECCFLVVPIVHPASIIQMDFLSTTKYKNKVKHMVHRVKNDSILWNVPTQKEAAVFPESSLTLKGKQNWNFLYCFFSLYRFLVFYQNCCNHVKLLRKTTSHMSQLQ